MKKIILLFTFSAVFVLSAFSQVDAGFGKFNLGVYGAMPLLNMRKIFDGGIGGSLKYEYNLSHNIKYLKKSYVANRLFITLESGFEAFVVKNELQNANVPSTYTYIPIKIGVKYYALAGLYAEAQYGTCNYGDHGGGHAPDYSGGIGYSFKPGFELGVRYEKWTQFPQNHVHDQYGQTGPFASTSNFSQLAVRLSERF
jgi:hypothetical protein